MIEAKGLMKQYGEKVAVHDLTFSVRPGIVTGFLGPNGAGKSTTMRMIIGLDSPSKGVVTVNGRAYARHTAPLHEVGALLEAKAVHNGRSARNHLLVLAATCGIPTRRVDALLDLVGLSAVASRRVGGFSLGMGQRLGIAAALLGDPSTLILDEPVNGLDPDGILWIRNLLRTLAGEGRTVLVSSHLMAEMALTAEHLLVIGRGRLIADVSVADFIRNASTGLVDVRTPDGERLREAVAGPTVRVTSSAPGRLQIGGMTSDQIGDLAAAEGIRLHELVPRQASLEDAFMDLTHDSIEYQRAEEVAR